MTSGFLHTIFPKALLAALLITSVEAQQAGALKIVIIEGGNTENSLPRKLGAPVVVEVRDETNRIVPAARVQFTTPASGPSVEVDGSHIFLAWTDTTGRASVTGIVPNSQEGRFPIAVEAQFAGKTGSTTFDEINSPVETEFTRTLFVKKPDHKLRDALIITGAIAATGLAIGLSLALTGGSGGGPTTAVSVGGISVGSPQ